MKQKDRDLIAQMAASIYPHFQIYDSTIGREQLAVDAAVQLLNEVDNRVSVRKQNLNVETSGRTERQS